MVLFSVLFQHEAELKIYPTEDQEVFKVIYKADFDWNVELVLENEKGRKKFSKKIEKTRGFLLPINMSGESSGVFTVTVSTPAYDVSESFDYLTPQDRLAQIVGIEYKPEKQSVTLSSTAEIGNELMVSIVNDQGDVLVSDKVPPSENSIYRVYNLAGAPGRRIEVRVYTSGFGVLNQSFDF